MQLTEAGGGTSSESSRLSFPRKEFEQRLSRGSRTFSSLLVWKHFCSFIKYRQVKEVLCPLSLQVSSAAAAAVLGLFVPSQPHGGAVDLGILALGPCGLMEAPFLSAQTLVDVRGHGEEHLLHVLRALGAGLQEGDLQGRGQVLGGEKAGLRHLRTHPQLTNIPLVID